MAKTKPEQKTTALAAPKPAALQKPDDFSGLGNTSIGANDVQMPRLKLLQALSEAVTNDEAPAGVFFNNLTSENYGQVVTIVPVIGFKNRVYMEQGKGLLCRSLDMEQGIGTPGIKCADCALKDWPEDRGSGGPKCRESRNWVGLIVAAAGGDTKVKKGEALPMPTPLDEPAFIVIQFTSTASAAAKKLNGLFMNSRVTNPTARWHDYQFNLIATPAKNDKGAFFTPDVRPAGRTTPEQKAAAESLMAFMGGRTLSVDIDAEDVDPAVDTNAEAPAGTPTF